MTRWHPSPPPIGFDRTAGLLGGSFNPAHAGHLHITREAIRRLGLDEVWWLVSPQNPLKEATAMAPAEERLDSAIRQARHPDIRVTDIEGELETNYTAKTLRKLRARFGKARFVWLMGADNLAQIPEWKDWKEIFNAVPIAVLDRPHYSLRALAGAAAARFSAHRLPEDRAKQLADHPPPVWVFLHITQHPASATEIRARRGEEWHQEK